MYLRELRLNGFKSFADPTRLDLQTGVTAIVGPNGCGKSNIADAIRWVLGEQSAKSLRAGAMQDVIFQGTTNRKPVNLCEVSLVFADCEAQLGTAYSEVEVTRRVVRDGGSEYYLNGKQCRLKDIQRLFLDTGVGQVSYSFMLQGQIDQILSTNPSERRTIFEEAAGISKYKAQRREALNKLSHVEANLARVTDVIDEVSRQIGSLKRQASKALRYKRIKHRLTHLELASGAHRHAELDEQVTELERKAAFLRKEVEKIHAELESAEAGLSGKRQRRTTLSAHLQELQQNVFDLRSEKENAQNKAEFSIIRADDLQQRIVEMEQELRELADQKRLLDERLEGEHRAKQEQMDLFGSSDEIFKQKSEELNAYQNRLAEAETELSRAKQALGIKEGSISRLRSNTTTLEVDLKTYQVRHANLTEEIHSLGEEAELIAQDADQIRRTLAQRIREREEHNTKVNEAREQVSSLTTEFRSLQSAIQDVDRQRASLNAQISALEGLQERFEGFSEGAKAILKGKLEDVIAPSDVSVVMKGLQVDSAYVKRFEVLVGMASDALFVRDVRRVSELAEALSNKKLGRASLAMPAPERPEPSHDNLPASIIPAWKQVSAKEEALGKFISNLLKGCYFCDDLKGFLDFWASNPKFEFNLVVTEAGEIIDRRGLVFAGGTRSGKDASFLARENELKKLRAEFEQVQDKLESRRLQAQQLQKKIDAAEKRVEDQRRIVMEIAEEISNLQGQEKSAARNVETNQRTLRAKQDELERLENSKEASLRKLEDAQAELKSVEDDIEAQKEKIAACEAEVVKVRDEREQMRESFNEVRLEMAEKKQRLELLDRGLDELRNQRREVEGLTMKRENELGMLREQIVQMKAESEEFAARAAEVDEKLADIMKELEAHRQSLQAVEREIQVVEEGLGSKRENHDRLSREMNTVDVTLAKQQSQLEFIVDEIRREYDVDISTIDWKRQLWNAGEELPDRIRVDIEEESPEEMPEEFERGDPTEDDLNALDETEWRSVREEVDTLRSRINSMGPVNLVAIEEYKELKERHEFLKSQSDDLWNAKDQLVQAIDEINDKSQELFANTFEQIRKNFKFTFDTLFGGGAADLQLVDNEDVLESGIDISAQPPGTRLKSLALLSGGQKTMTAVALLFAIYMVKPSPFCVLDEIDAPLDDANIGRFCKMLEQFLEFSQFLIITHNKRTISIADTIYGATMQERGVSRIVSMRFNRDTGEAETVAATQEAGEFVQS